MSRLGFHGSIHVLTAIEDGFDRKLDDQVLERAGHLGRVVFTQDIRSPKGEDLLTRSIRPLKQDDPVGFGQRPTGPQSDRLVRSVCPALIGSVAPVRILVWRLAVALQDAGGFELGVGGIDPVELDGELPIVAEVVGQLHRLSRLEGERSD